MSILRAVAASGHHDKLAIGFTNFDLLKGQANLPTLADQRAHVMAIVNQALISLREVVGVPVVRAISRDIDENCFMLGYLDKAIGSQNPAPARELRRLFDHLQAAGKEEEPTTRSHPVYEPARLYFSVQGALAEFHAYWNARLGFGGAPNVPRAHWAEVKALNRRVALRIDNFEYAPAGLMPVAYLKARLSEWITRYLDTPLRWKGEQPSDEDAEAALGLVQRAVYERLEGALHRRLIETPHQRWVSGFHLRGRGSTFDRARAVQTIFIENAPLPGPVLDLRSIELLREMQILVHDAIGAAGGTLLGEPLG